MHSRLPGILEFGTGFQVRPDGCLCRSVAGGTSGDLPDLRCPRSVRALVDNGLRTMVGAGTKTSWGCRCLAENGRWMTATVPYCVLPLICGGCGRVRVVRVIGSWRAGR